MSKSPTTAPSTRETSFHQATPTHGRHLATHLMKRLPTCPIPEITRLGQTLRTWKDTLDASFDTAGASNAPHQNPQRNHRTRHTHRQRLPQPHQLPTPNAPHRRRPRRLHPHPTPKSPITYLFLRFLFVCFLKQCWVLVLDVFFSIGEVFCLFND